MHGRTILDTFQRVLTDGDDTPEELEEKRRKAIESAHSEDGEDSNGGADGDHEGKLLTGGWRFAAENIYSAV